MFEWFITVSIFNIFSWCTWTLSICSHPRKKIMISALVMTTDHVFLADKQGSLIFCASSSQWLLPYPGEVGGVEQAAGQSLGGGGEVGGAQLQPLLRSPAKIWFSVGEERVAWFHWGHLVYTGAGGLPILLPMVAPSLGGVGQRGGVQGDPVTETDGVRGDGPAYSTRLCARPSSPASSSFLLSPPPSLSPGRWLPITVPGRDVQLGQGHWHPPLVGGQGQTGGVNLIHTDIQIKEECLFFCKRV